MNIKFYITICDKYLHLLEGYQYLFNQFCKEKIEVIFLGYKKPDFELEKNFKFISLGKDLGVSKWSNAYVDYFQSIKDEYFIFGCEDMWMIRDINIGMIKYLLNYFKDGAVSKIALTEDLRLRGYDIIPKLWPSHIKGNTNFEVIECHQTTDYRLSTQYAIWRRDYLLKYLHKNMTCWEFELQDGLHANGPKDDGARIIGIYSDEDQNYPIHACDVINRTNMEAELDFKNRACIRHDMRLEDKYIKKIDKHMYFDEVNQFQPYIGDEEYEAIKACFDTNWITEGPKSKEFSKNLLELMGSKYGVFTPNGTLALYLGLRAIDIGPGDEVIVPNFTFIASANAVQMSGAKPVFVDINKDDLQINVDDCNRVLNKNTKAIMPVHIFGLSANMDEVMEFADKNNLKIIEDACQAIGIKWDGKHCGTFGDIGCFSFFADKTITTGEGGFVTTDNEEVYNKLLYLRNQGRLNRGTFIHPEMGYNFRITDIQAAMGIVQLNKLDDIIDKKLNLLKLYKERLDGVDGVRIVEPDSKSNHIPFRVVLMCDKPATDLIKVFDQNNIEARTVFYPLHKQPCYVYLDESQDQAYEKTFSNSIYAYEHGMCLPSYPELQKSKVDYICNVIKEYCNT